MSKLDYFKETMRDYDRLRQRADAILQARKDEVYAKSGRLREIDEALNALGISATKRMLNTEECAESPDFKRLSQSLIEEKSSLLSALGIAPDYLTNVYKCPLCKDTGFVGNERCACLRQHLIKRYYSGANLSKAFKDENFDTFDLNYYSDAIDPKNGVSPKANIKWIWMTCLNFVNDFERERRNLLMYGTSGLGKTFLCNCIAKEILEKGCTVFYTTSSQLFKTVEELRFNRSDFDEEPSGFLTMLTDVDLLIIDDLGTEFMTIVTSSELFNIINTRLLFSRSTIISTNLSQSELTEQYSDRITSRIVGGYIMLKFFGDDIRLKKKYGM